MAGVDFGSGFFSRMPAALRRLSFQLPLIMPSGVNVDRLARAVIGLAFVIAAYMAAAVRGGTASSGGSGSMIAGVGAALFLSQLGQMLRIMGLSTAHQYIIEGIAIALGMWLSAFSGRFRLSAIAERIGKLR